MNRLWLVITIVLLGAIMSLYAVGTIPDPIPSSGGKLLLRDELLRMSEP